MSAHPAVGYPDELAMRLAGLRYVIDTREQRPWDFEGVEVVHKAMPAGDYSIETYETTFAIERKSIEDLVGSLIGKERRPRFEREMETLSKYARALVVVEGHLDDVLGGFYRSGVKPQSVIASLASIHARWNVATVYLGNPGSAARFARQWLSKCLTHCKRAEAA